MMSIGTVIRYVWINGANFVLCAALLASPLAATAQQRAQPWIEYEQRQNTDTRLTALGPDLMGDRIDPNSGAITFEHTDVSLPGNSKLEVSLKRRLTQGYLYGEGVNAEFGNWQYVVPRIVAVSSTAGWNGARCNNSFATSFPTITRVGTGIFPGPLYSSEYSNGVSVEIPGGASQQMLESPQGSQWPAGRKYVTADNWYFTCVGATPTGEGFMGYAPNGDRYRFDRYINRPFRPLGVMLTSKSSGTPRTKSILAATEVTDVNGNWVRYAYDSSDRLTSITANDGRQINLIYQGTSLLVSQVIANPTGGSRTWSYMYGTAGAVKPYWEGGGAINIQSLASVLQPDGRSWTFELGGMFAEPTPGECSTDYLPNLRITHPYGAVGTFVLKEARHRYGLLDMMEYTLDCPSAETPAPSQNPQFVLQQNDTISVHTKKIEGYGLTPQTWAFDYEYDNGARGSSESDPTNWTRVVEPDGTELTYYHRWGYGSQGGMLYRTETRRMAGSLPLEILERVYVNEAAAGQSFGQLGTDVGFLKIVPHRTIIKRGNETTAGQFDTFTTLFGYDHSFTSATYSYGFPTQVTETSSSSSLSRETSIGYLHDKSLWIVGLPQSVVRNGEQIEYNSYDSLKRLQTRSRFGALEESYTYRTESGQLGSIATIKDALNRTYTLSNWHRGKPKTVQRPDGSTFVRTINDDGWVTGETDGRGNSTGFGYNMAGWLMAVIYPTADTVTWTNPITTYSYLAAAELGMPAGTLKAQRTEGRHVTSIYHDAQLRPIFVEDKDTTSNIAIYKRKRFDHDGRPTFESYPSSTQAASAGIETFYDALDRVTKRQTTAGVPLERIQYLPGHRQQITDADNKSSTISYQALGNPSYDQPTRIDGQETQVTAINRDVFGKVNSIVQSGSSSVGFVSATRSFTYDSRHRPCRRIDPESGSTVWGYNAANEMTWEAEGQSGSGCLASAPAGASYFSYDSRGRKQQDDHPGSTDDVTIGYDAESNVTSVSNPAVTWSYSYNKLNLLETEQAVIDSKVLTLDPTYNGLKHVDRLATPSQTVLYAPDAWGRATQLGTWVTSIGYHPNSAPSGYMLGNGLSYMVTLDNRLRPQRQRLLDVSSAVQDLEYAYTDAGNLSSITDRKDGADNATLFYDGLHRLQTASGLWGSWTYNYDSLNNLRSRVGGSNLTYSYDTTNNRLSGVSGAHNRNYSYNSKGEITGDGSKNFTLNNVGQIQSVNGVADYLYDGNGRRIKTTLANGNIEYTLYDRSGRLAYRETISKQTASTPLPPLALQRSSTTPTNYVLLSSMNASRSAAAPRANDPPPPFPHDTLVERAQELVVAIRDSRLPPDYEEVIRWIDRAVIPTFFETRDYVYGTVENVGAGALITTAQNAVSDAADLYTSTYATARTTAAGAAQTAVDTYRAALNDAGTAYGTVYETAGNAAVGAAQTAVDTYRTTLNDAGAAYGTVYETAGNTAAGAAQTAVGVYAAALDFARNPPATPQPPQLPPVQPPALPPLNVPPVQPPSLPPTQPPTLPPVAPPQVPPVQLPPTQLPPLPPTQPPALPPIPPLGVPPTNPPTVPPLQVPPVSPPTVPPVGLPPTQQTVEVVERTDYLSLGGKTLAELKTNSGVTSVTYLHVDLLGSPRLATDSGKATVWREHYDPYGNRLSGNTGRVGYTGHVSDSETGLTYMQARFYDGPVGRFLSTDPVHFSDKNLFTFNRYAYGNNNPYRFTDPDGRQSVGEIIDAEADGCGTVSCAGWAGLNAMWKVFGAEGVSQLADKGSGAGGANVFLAVTEIATFGKGKPVAEVVEGATGIVYKRINPITGEQYVGQSINMARYIARQSEHNLRLGVRHIYEILGRAAPGKELRYLEESHIRAAGGLQKEGGPLANKIHAMSDANYQQFQGTFRVEGRLDSMRLGKELSGQ